MRYCHAARPAPRSPEIPKDIFPLLQQGRHIRLLPFRGKDSKIGIRLQTAVLEHPGQIPLQAVHPPGICIFLQQSDKILLLPRRVLKRSGQLLLDKISSQRFLRMRAHKSQHRLLFLFLQRIDLRRNQLCRIGII